MVGPGEKRAAQDENEMGWKPTSTHGGRPIIRRRDHARAIFQSAGPRFPISSPPDRAATISHISTVYCVNYEPTTSEPRSILAGRFVPGSFSCFLLPASGKAQPPRQASGLDR